VSVGAPVHVVMPEGVDDPTRPSGGNVYDRRICAGLTALGWTVRALTVPGSWPAPDIAACAALNRVVAAIPDGDVVLVDGLIASAAPDVLVPVATRLRLVVIVHMPLGEGPSGDPAVRAAERAVLSAAADVVTTSEWTRDRLLERYPLTPQRVHVAVPGADPAPLATGTPAGGRLLCVAAVTPIKGHDVLVSALATIADLTWQCDCVGSLDRDPEFAAAVAARVAHTGLADHVRFAGPLGGDGLEAAYGGSDLLVLASRSETYGMVVTEALARGIPVIAPAVGGLPEALGRGAEQGVPGVLVSPEDPKALAVALRGWLTDAGLRLRLRAAARERRDSLPAWWATSTSVSQVLNRHPMMRVCHSGENHNGPHAGNR
jgi:glycosyltransferase involved in cell wall biosynthesis